MFVVFPEAATLHAPRPVRLLPIAVPTWRISSIQPLAARVLCRVDAERAGLDAERAGLAFPARAALDDGAGGVGRMCAGCGVGLFDGSPLFVPESLEEILSRISLA